MKFSIIHEENVLLNNINHLNHEFLIIKEVYNIKNMFVSMRKCFKCDTQIELAFDHDICKSLLKFINNDNTLNCSEIIIKNIIE